MTVHRIQKAASKDRNTLYGFTNYHFFKTKLFFPQVMVGGRRQAARHLHILSLYYVGTPGQT